MRLYVLFVMMMSMVLVGALSPFMASAAVDQDLTDRLRGYTLLSVDGRGELYYVNPDSGVAKYLGTYQATWDVIKNEMIGITNADLARVETDAALRERLMGRFLLAVESNGEVHYLRPSDQKLHYLGTGASTFDKLKFLALGVNNENLNKLQLDQGSVVVTPAPTPTPEVPATPLPEVNTYTNGQMALDFVNIFVTAYDAFEADFGYYPDIKWFEGLIQWNQPIYFTENGFGLAPGETNYFVWSKVDAEFSDFYYNYLDTKIDWNDYRFKFYLPSAISTDQGVLEAGYYHYTNIHGFVTDAEYQAILDGDKVVEEQVPSANEEAARVIEAVRTIQSGVREYWEDKNTWPMTGQDPIYLGEFGAVKLTEKGHFWGTEEDKKVYIEVVESGAPSTRFEYSAPIWGQEYSLKFELHGYYEDFTPGKYEAVPFDKINRIGDLDQE